MLDISGKLGVSWFLKKKKSLANACNRYPG